jgi:hypothetical protein
LKHARSFNDGRFSLPLSELGGFGAVCINTSKFLSVLVKNRHLPMLVLASSVFPQLGAFSFFQQFVPGFILSQLELLRASADSSNTLQTKGKDEIFQRRKDAFAMRQLRNGRRGRGEPGRSDR